MIRSFIAVELAPEILQNIALAIDQLRPRIDGIRWAAPGNFHLTLKFLGNVDENRLDALCAALAPQIHPFPPCTINAKGLGVFPDVKRPRILWVGLTGNELIDLARRIEASLAPLGFAPEARAFMPHLTIGRWRQVARAPQALAAQLEQWHAREFGCCQVNEVVLFQSLLKPQGAEYRKLQTFALRA